MEGAEKAIEKYLTKKQPTVDELVNWLQENKEGLEGHIKTYTIDLNPIIVVFDLSQCIGKALDKVKKELGLSKNG